MERYPETRVESYGEIHAGGVDFSSLDFDNLPPYAVQTPAEAMTQSRQAALMLAVLEVNKPKADKQLSQAGLNKLGGIAAGFGYGFAEETQGVVQDLTTGRSQSHFYALAA